MTLHITGKEASKYFQHERGIHCIQRVPPTERGGRVHTSIVSVAILALPPVCKSELKQSDIEVQTTRGSGPGGQHRNKNDTAVKIIHKPTGLQIYMNGKSQHQNKKQGLRILTEKVRQYYQSEATEKYNSNRHQQLGTKGRGNKIRTYNFKKHRVVDHQLGTKTSRIEDVMSGNFDLILK